MMWLRSVNFFDKIPKGALRSDLLQEQHGLCAYCMRRIANDHHTKVEHFIPLSKNKETALDYGNFLAVCDGGESSQISGKRILCCDSSKGDIESLTLDPRNASLIRHLSYNKEGVIKISASSTLPQEVKTAIDRDINQTLRLNGLLSDDGTPKQDTATQIVKGRRDAHAQYTKMIKSLLKKGPLTASRIEREIVRLKSQPQYQPFVGVILFFLERRKRRL